MVKKVVINFVLFYKKFISPIFVLFFGGACRFTPTCSEYANTAIRRFGIYRGGMFSIKRFFKCNPLSSGYFDSVPE